MKGSYRKHILKFKIPGGTSRGVLTEKETWFILLEEAGKTGIGECGILRGLSADDRPDYEEKLQWVIAHLHMGKEHLLASLKDFPSIQFGLEQAFLSLHASDPFLLFPSAFTSGRASIPINGLIWMGDPGFMKQQIEQKLEEGYKCIKLKIGAIDFKKELALIEAIRTHFSIDQIEIRVDANGAFTSVHALDRLNDLASFSIHSIEQPIKPGQWSEMAKLCQKMPVPIALDEELIGVFDTTKKEQLLQEIRPQYIILKPSFVGGFAGSEEWICLAEKYGAGWWVTSALESNIGLNAIAQWTYTKNVTLPQGLGTGGLFTNNFDAPLRAHSGFLEYIPQNKWNVNLIA
ncbi:o-succinylbenzoate synthase [Ascidiimonas aurantiaca]|uniref:o-succinylbenzoate synthase n=1 Tax=Ascidiimonas aurantiaca TaxID=1685432 RepID=UPI0030EBA9FE